VTRVVTVFVATPLHLQLVFFFLSGFVGFSLEKKKIQVDICSWEILSPRACNYYQPIILISTLIWMLIQ
jgi:hypothetical protein